MPGEYGPTARGRFAARTGLCDMSRSSFYRSVLVGAPLAPRSRIELGAREAGVLEREQIVTRRDAGSAVANDVLDRRAADRREQTTAELLRRPERAALVHVLLEEIVLRA